MVVHLQEIARLSGMSLDILGKIESGMYKNPTVETLAKIANVLGVKIAICFIKHER